MNPLKAIQALFVELLDQPVEDLVLRLTLLTLLLHGSSTAWLDVPLNTLCGFMLISRNHFRSAGLWLIICVLTWWVNATDWLWIDNHKYLISYWVLACTLAVMSERTKNVLAWNGRILVGLTFAFAFFWKGLAGEYWNGDFFYYTLLLDGRMEVIANVVGGVSLADLAQMRILEDMVDMYPGETVEASLYESGRLRALAIAMAWWTLIIEAAIAAFLVTRGRIALWRDWILLAFIAATYFFVPVLGFGYILVILGLASCRVEAKWARVAYLGVLIILQLGRLPWEDFLPYWLA